MDHGCRYAIVRKWLPRADAGGIGRRRERVEDRNAASEIAFELTIRGNEGAGIGRTADTDALVITEQIPSVLSPDELRNDERPTCRRSELVPSQRAERRHEETARI